MRISDIFYSLQGEAAYAGQPCVFVRVAGCPYRCHYCDALGARTGGKEQDIASILAEVRSHHPVSLVQVTGGEPLAQAETPLLLSALMQEGFRVLLETSGHEPLDPVPDGVAIQMDIKTPGSGGPDFCVQNLALLDAQDAIKFVVCGPADFKWAKELILRHDLASLCQVFFLPSFGKVSPSDLGEWILEARLPVRLGVQLHKILWGERTMR